MPSSYSTSFSLEKIATGEQSGTWGTTSNHNWDIVDRLTAYAAVALSGTTHTLTVREASPESGTENLQDGMYRVIKFTGALGAANTVTIAPNTTKAFFIIHNATTDSGSGGPYSVILSQGSGANVTVANGKSAIVYCDGAGAGAAVVDAVANLALATLTTSGVIRTDDATDSTSGTSGSIQTDGGIGAVKEIVTDATFKPLGDTAASDKAAMGYTAAEGLILTGQGSTNDVTIKNDADGDVLTIPTGATGVVLAGALTTGGTTTLGGAIAGADNQVGRVNLIDYGEVTNALGDLAGGTDDIDLTAGNSVSATVSTSEQTFTFSNPTASDELCGFTLTLTNGGSQTVNWPASVDWAGATAPTLTTSGVDILIFFTIDGGTIWHGMVASTDSS